MLLRGTLQTWLKSEGYGLITSDKGIAEILVIASVLQGDDYLSRGERVLFEMEWDITKHQWFSTICVSLGDPDALQHRRDERQTRAAADALSEMLAQELQEEEDAIQNAFMLDRLRIFGGGPPYDR